MKVLQRQQTSHITALPLFDIFFTAVFHFRYYKKAAGYSLTRHILNRLFKSLHSNIGNAKSVGRNSDIVPIKELYMYEKYVHVKKSF